MKRRFSLVIITCVLAQAGMSQIDPTLLRRVPKDTSATQMNLDAVYNRPFFAGW